VSFWNNLFWPEFKLYYWFKNKIEDFRLNRKIKKKLQNVKKKDPFIYK